MEKDFVLCEVGDKTLNTVELNISFQSVYVNYVLRTLHSE
jgi:hypothetical protein